MNFALHAQYGHALTHKNPALGGGSEFTLLADLWQFVFFQQQNNIKS